MSLIREFSESLRQLRRAPGFTLSAVCMLGFGIAISVAMFSLLRGVLLAALPYPAAGQLVSLHATASDDPQNIAQLTPAEAVQLAQAVTDHQAGAGSAIQQFGYYNWGGMTLFDGEHPREASIALVSNGFFPALGLQPELGRWFAPEEHAGSAGVVVISHEEWQRGLGGRADVIGSQIDTSEGRLRVIGVMPDGFGYPTPQIGAWLPRAPYSPGRPGYGQARFVFGVARLAAGTTPELLDQQFAAAARVVSGESGTMHWTLSSLGLLDETVGDLRGTLWSAFAIAVLVLLIAAVNVVILFDARQVQRAQARNVAQALGASGLRLWRVQLLELALLALGGGVLGVLLAWSGLGALRELASSSLPRSEGIVLAGSVLVFAGVLVLLVPLIAALLTWPRESSPSALALRAGRGMIGSRQGWRRLLPAIAVGLSTTSLAAAVALGLSLIRLQQVDPGFEPHGVRALQLFRPGAPAQLQSFVDSVQAKLAALPGVSGVSFSAAPPLAISASLGVDLTVSGRAEPEPYRAGLRRVGPDYLSLLKIPLKAGRALDARDSATAEPVAVISAELARRSFGERPALGELLRIAQPQGELSVRVVGVMADTRNAGLRSAPEPELLLPYAQEPASSLTLLVRTAGDVALSDRELTAQVWALDPRQAVFHQYRMDEELASQLLTTRFFASAIGAFAIAAFALAAFGVYAVAALRQRQKMREFGLRAAIGARARTLGLKVLRDGLVDVLPGALLGIVGATLALRLLAEELYTPQDSLSLVTALCVVAMLLAALAALLLPAWRASRSDPMRILRAEN